MTCDKCVRAHQEGAVAPIRVGNDLIGWGTVLIGGCTDHVKLVVDWINSKEEKEKKIFDLENTCSGLYSELSRNSENKAQYN